MGSKTISLREETYRRLDRAKHEGESFSDVVDRLLVDEDDPLRELVGFVEGDELEDVRRGSAGFREEVSDRFDGERGSSGGEDGTSR
ncbi:antitoxin VapB family protein [Natrononativus amylolyticus]|uniref:antitoxin VapB family protein n=1 Tax=Natrononativus amylolyticus TaxID=2963434 RepID=UPI0020CEEF08|nr:antitoxin VapB family protein [Natrononativus amylolyticus]